MVCSIPESFFFYIYLKYESLQYKQHTVLNKSHNSYTYLTQKQNFIQLEITTKANTPTGQHFHPPTTQKLSVPIALISLPHSSLLLLFARV